MGAAHALKEAQRRASEGIQVYGCSPPSHALLRHINTNYFLFQASHGVSRDTDVSFSDFSDHELLQITKPTPVQAAVDELL